MQYQATLTRKFENAKTGPIPVSTTSATTCPNSCALKSAGCYANGGPLAIVWRGVTNGTRGTPWAEFCDDVASLPDGQLWRHNQAGDLPGDQEAIDPDALALLVQANAGKRGFTYTHYDVMRSDNAGLVASANARGFTVNLSANNLDHADELASLGVGPVVSLLPADAMANTMTPQGRKVVICPAVVRDDVSCATCQLCQRQRDVIVGFPAHGSSKRKADTVARFKLTTSKAA
jgi:hypothetical protein